jgi:hypothetical protein
METTNNAIFNRIFTKNTFSEWIASDGGNSLTKSVQKFLSSTNMQNRSVISEVYNIMQRSYRNEYIYKNTLLNKLLLGRHSLNSTTALTEVPVQKSKADFILINGKAVVYEIKTELDNFDRLEGQLKDYYRAFDNVCVITSESSYKSVLSSLEHTNVGVLTLTKRSSISTKKEPVSDISYLDHNTMFKLLRKQEYENILMKYFGQLPNVTQVRYYKECLKLFMNITLEQAYKYMLIELKKRINIKDKIKFQKSVPYELKSLIYFSDYSSEDYEVLEQFLNQEFRG